MTPGVLTWTMSEREKGSFTSPYGAAVDSSTGERVTFVGRSGPKDVYQVNGLGIRPHLPEMTVDDVESFPLGLCDSRHFPV